MRVDDIDITPLIWLAIFSIVVGVLLLLRPRSKPVKRHCKREVILSDDEIDKRLRATSPYHWRKCPKCGHWSFGFAMCKRDLTMLDIIPTRDESIAFQSKLLPFWQELVKAAPEITYSENEVAGLYHLKERCKQARARE